MGVGGDGAVSVEGRRTCRGLCQDGVRTSVAHAVRLLTCVPSGLTVAVVDGLGIVLSDQGITITEAVLGKCAVFWYRGRSCPVSQ